MHEMSIAQNIADIVLSTAQKNMAGRVLGVRVQAGRMRGIVPDQLRFCFEFMVKGTIAEDADLSIEEIPVNVRCRKCGVRSELGGLQFICGACQSKDLETITGMELTVRDIRISSDSQTPR